MLATVVDVAHWVLFVAGMIVLAAVVLGAVMAILWRLIEPHRFEMEADLEEARLEREAARAERDRRKRQAAGL